MHDKIFVVKYITLKNCFCYFSHGYLKYIEQGNVVRINYGLSEVAYMSVASTLSHLKDSEIGINSIYAAAIGLQDNESVTVTTAANVSGITSLNLVPLCLDDYEILELLAENVQSTLLDQIRIVSNNQKLVIWIAGTLHITVEIDGIVPVSPGRLDNLSEVVITRPKAKKATPPKIGFKFADFFNEVKDEKSADYFEKVLTGAFQLIPLEFLRKSVPNFESLKIYQRPFDVFIRRNFPGDDLFNLKIIQPPGVDGKLIRDLVVKVHVLEAVGDSLQPVLYVNKNILDYFNLKIGSKAILEKLTDFTENVNRVEISTDKPNLKIAIEHFKLFLSEHSDSEKLLLNSEIPIEIGKDFFCTLKFSPGNFALVDGDFVRNCKFSVNEMILPKSLLIKSENRFCSNFNFDKIVQEVTDCLNLGLKSDHFENVLIVGKPGSGKSTLTKAISKEIVNFPLFIHVETVTCKKVKGKSVESLQKLFANVFINLIYYQPSLLILDDLDMICQKVVETDAVSPETLHFNRVSEMISDFFDNYLKRNKIAILSTTESVLKLNQNVYSSRGKHFFKNVFEIQELSKSNREIYLKFLLPENSLDFESLALKTEGFVIQDLTDFADKADFERLKEGVGEQITAQHCEAALQRTKSLALKNVNLNSPGDRDFSDIGGLEEVKKILVEYTLWPIKYPTIFSKSPLRLQSGLLLYGPPGTGKTILAAAAAKHCGLRLISVKGPELLSKYIGASEQAVRNVFQNAQSAKPCVLFFDEFDSLAPRRGHDSTGVTDRVVNQLLTQLDGVESLDGVCVIAATSRPDLLDPALLRPGRLDSQMLCPLPDRKTRFEILKALSKTLNFSEDVDLTTIADGTEGYSGADLQAVLYTAQLSAVEGLLKEEENKANLTQGDTVVTQRHLENSVRATRPSLTKEEKLKFQAIYAKFQTGSDLLNVKSGRQKATLA